MVELPVKKDIKYNILVILKEKNSNDFSLFIFRSLEHNKMLQASYYVLKPSCKSYSKTLSVKLTDFVWFICKAIH